MDSHQNRNIAELKNKGDEPKKSVLLPLRMPGLLRLALEMKAAAQTIDRKEKVSVNKFCNEILLREAQDEYNEIVARSQKK